MNINRFLENSQRSDVIGRNIYTRGATGSIWEKTTSEQWDPPAIGLSGTIAMGHEIPLRDLITLSVTLGQSPLVFSPVRNHWTPAYMETIYRSNPDEYNPRAGSVTLKEVKGFLPDDTFVSEVTIRNDRREAIDLAVQLVLPLEKGVDNFYSLEKQLLNSALYVRLTLKGSVYAATDSETDSLTLHIPAGGFTTFRYALAFRPLGKEEEAKTAALAGMKRESPSLDSEKAFNEWMKKNLPTLETENTDILKVYYYRAFLLYHAIHTPDTLLPDHIYSGECVYESPFGGWYGCPVGLPLPLHLEEMKWMRQTDSVKSMIRNWTTGRGNTWGYIQATPMAVWRLYQHDGDAAFLAEVYDACMKYTAQTGAFNSEKGLPLCTGSWRTGAEYQPSFYQYTNPAWDWRYDTEGARVGFPHARVYRLDEISFLGGNLIACRNMAHVLGKAADEKEMDKRASFIISRLKDTFWDPEKRFFYDCEPEKMRRCDKAACYDGFAPFMWNLVGKGYDDAFDALTDPARFGSEYPASTVEKGCPMYWYNNEIAGPTASSREKPHPYGCSWNGPTWPFANSLILEGLGAAATENESLRPLFVSLFEQFTDMHFHDGDRSVPLMTEHYCGSDGVSFSHTIDYFHSEWLAPFFAYWAGVDVTEDKVGFRPMTKDAFTLRGVMLHGKEYDFSQDENGTLTVAKH